jgi:hypothetical protein
MEDGQTKVSVEKRRDIVGILISGLNTVLMGTALYFSKTSFIASDFFRKKGTPEELNLSNKQQILDMRDQALEGIEDKNFFGKAATELKTVPKMRREIAKNSISWRESFNNQSNLSKAATIILALAAAVNLFVFLKETMFPSLPVHEKVEGASIAQTETNKVSNSQNMQITKAEAAELQRKQAQSQSTSKVEDLTTARANAVNNPSQNGLV